MRTLVATTAWLLACGALDAALFWAFLNTPESTVWTLGVSALLVLVMFVVTGATVNASLVAWTSGWSAAAVARAVRGLLVFAVALTIAGLSWWLVGRVQGWIDGRSGEISAWFIARLGWSDVQPLIGAAGWVCDWVRMLVAPFMALTWLAGWLLAGPESASRAAPLRRALSPLRLAAATAIGVVFLWLPWTYGARWVPRGLSATWVEPVFAVAKFAGIAIVGAIGVALITRLASRGRSG